MSATTAAESHFKMDLNNMSLDAFGFVTAVSVDDQREKNNARAKLVYDTVFQWFDYKFSTGVMPTADSFYTMSDQYSGWVNFVLHTGDRILKDEFRITLRYILDSHSKSAPWTLASQDRGNTNNLVFHPNPNWHTIFTAYRNSGDKSLRQTIERLR